MTFHDVLEMGIGIVTYFVIFSLVVWGAFLYFTGDTEQAHKDRIECRQHFEKTTLTGNMVSYDYSFYKYEGNCCQYILENGTIRGECNENS